MKDIKDVINAIDIDHLSYQVLSNALSKKELKGRKGDKYTSITFETNVECMDQEKEALILWVDKDKWLEVVNKIVKAEVEL